MMMDNFKNMFRLSFCLKVRQLHDFVKITPEHYINIYKTNIMCNCFILWISVEIQVQTSQ